MAAPRLQQWLDCEGLPLRKCNRYRERHGLPPIGQAPPPKQKLRGLGDVVAAATKAVGITPCLPCQQRQEWLNQAVPFGGQ